MGRSEPRGEKEWELRIEKHELLLRGGGMGAKRTTCVRFKGEEKNAIKATNLYQMSKPYA